MKIEDFILLVKSSEVNAHIYHLSTAYYGHHKALQTYYEEVRDLFDSFVETAQGKFGIKYSLVGNIEISSLSVENYFGNLSHQIDLMVVNLLSEYKDLENIGLEILALINQTRYRLSLQ